MLHHNLKLSYTPALEPYELNERALLIDTETIGRGQTVEIIEIAIADHRGQIVFETLVKPSLNRLPSPSKHQRFDRAELEAAPQWAEVWPQLSQVIENKLLVAYNAAYDRRVLAVTCALHRLTSTERAWRCAMQLVKTRMGLRYNPTLGEACAFYGLEGGNHRAGRDTQAMFEMLRKVCQSTAAHKR
jgi:DNA polymerase III epsilon subunit-like protein